MRTMEDRPRLGYAPVADDRADPGEVVWAWVPYEEDASRGKDRPVLVIGREGPRLLALPLTGQDHDRDAAQEAGAGRLWTDIGSGAWDERRRPSEARVNRLLRLDREAVRRTGAQLDEAVFERVVAEVRGHYPEL
ncbi:RNA 3'-terminal phosphate cyclase [Serinicoccus hydrothermalis]|uniref:RNA 3'-terminal phosphate cyclase n=2 Tax=Serinicoccus hydrothermalis TaxID=1758689 RepID=A0A1B1N7N3_9MICO|nr:RNA 3'-terminal phosphate cyclase [Serinicoccus hydrothermalis]